MSQIIGDVLTLGSAGGGADNTRWLLFSVFRTWYKL